MSVFHDNTLIGSSGQTTGGFKIERSLRFNSADSAYLNRTQGSGSRTTWTYSFWMKLGVLSTDTHVFTFADPANVMYLNNVGQLLWYDGNAASFYLIPTQRFRDHSSWYHVVAVADTNNATQGDRIRLYVNGTRITAFTTANYPASGYTTGANQSGTTATIGRSTSSFNGYLTEINFIDGQALTPSSFGETDTDTGVWKPKKYTGTYGTNGFYLNFSDNSGTTSTTLGKDSSGNGNNWTPNNFSVTAGAGNDSLVDTPTNYGTDTGVGGEVRGNYATWNPLDKNSNGSLVNGNLDNSNGSQNNAGVRSTFALPSSGKWYAELRVNSNTGSTVALGFGFATASADLAGSVDSANKYVIYGSSSGSIFSNTSTITGGLGAFSSGDILQIAYDGATGKAWLGKNNTWYNSSGGTTGNPGSGTNQTFTLTGEMFLFSYYYNVSGSLNAGQRAFSYTAPSGFKALCTQNLPEPTIADGGDYFNTVLYTGNASTQSITGVGFQPDWVWVKNRTVGANHRLFDAVRGASKILYSSLTNAEATDTTGLTSFDADGFSIGANQVNDSGSAFVAWNWKANGAGSSNTAGTITSTVSVNTTSGFSIVTYTGTGANATVGHGLGVAPNMIIIKSRSGAGQPWHIYTSMVGNTKALFFDTSAETTSSQFWNNTSPTSTVFTVGTSGGVNGSGATLVAYAFAAVAGYSAFGSYTGNGSTDGTFVYTGFRPRFVMVKRSSAAGEPWQINDTARNPSNLANLALHPNASDAEATYGSAVMDILSNGFKLRGSDAYVNASGSTYIYMAFAENPFKFSLAR